MHYVMSDIHGDYERYLKMLEKIKFGDNDMLYIIGDIVDRGDKGLKILSDMMLRSNVIPILGNHEYMLAKCFDFVMQEITDKSIEDLEKNGDLFQGILEWINVGGSNTISEMKRMPREDLKDILDYLSEFTLYECIKVKDKEFILVHAGLKNFSIDKCLDDYKLYELIFETPDYNKTYFEDKYLVTGHLPNKEIWAKTGPKRDDIYIKNNHIAIDCGCGFDGRLGCLCLETFEEFYV